MTDNENRRHLMFVRVREFFAQRLADFSETAVARQLFAELVAIITTLDGYAAAQAAGIGQPARERKRADKHAVPCAKTSRRSAASRARWICKTTALQNGVAERVHVQSAGDWLLGLRRQ